MRSEAVSKDIVPQISSQALEIQKQNTLIQKQNDMIYLKQKQLVPRLANKRILIVDDESFNRMAVHSVLEILGIESQDELCVDAKNG